MILLCRYVSNIYILIYYLHLILILLFNIFSPTFFSPGRSKNYFVPILWEIKCLKAIVQLK